MAKNFIKKTDEEKKALTEKKESPGKKRSASEVRGKLYGKKKEKA